MMRRVAGAVLVVNLFCVSAPSGLGAQSAAPGVEAAARALVPLLNGVRERLQPRVGVQPGTLPPSPFTGQQSTAVAMRIGKGDVRVDENVRQAVDRLLAWDRKVEPETDDATLFVHWLDHVRVRATTMRPPGTTSLDCDTACAVERFTKPGEAFGRSKGDREEMRDQLLLEALASAVRELQP